jgi:hypothetical protein
MDIDRVTGILALIPDMGIDIHFWGLGGHANVFGGSLLAASGRFASSLVSTQASDNEGQAATASKTAGLQRRADDWILQHNLAAHEVMQNGRQILTSLIAEQIAHHEHESTQRQIDNSNEINDFLQDKFSNEELHLWMQGELSRLYYEYYRFAFDTARRAERSVKQELMRPELDAQDFVKFNYWDGGRKGLLSGEALHLDLKRLEMAYLDNNKRELELTRHVSLRTLGACSFSIPEWLYDRDCPGHYMRRIKSVALSIPSVTGPYTSVNCTVSLLRSSIRTSAIAASSSDYLPTAGDDSRFVSYAGAIQSIVTSAGNTDSGMFETNLRDERVLPFEGAGAISSWQLTLPSHYRSFDYMSISDVILHIRYTARQGIPASVATGALATLLASTAGSDLKLLFSLRHDFPNEWSAFVNGTASFSAVVRLDSFPYFAQPGPGRPITVTKVELYAAPPGGPLVHVPVGTTADWTAFTNGLNGAARAFTVTSAPNAALARSAGAQSFLVVQYTVG